MTAITARQWYTARRLLVAAAVCLFGIHALFLLTESAEKRSEKRHLINALQGVLPPHFDWDNDLLGSQSSRDNRTLYWACQTGLPRYQIVEFSTHHGYNGLIKLIMAVDIQQASITRIRPLFHQETPGLGDQIEPNKSDWLLQFNLALPPQKRLSIRRDGGDIDSIAGATITARAITDAIAQQAAQFHVDAPLHHCKAKLP